MSDIDRLANQLILNKDTASAVLLNKELTRKGMLNSSEGYPIYIEDLLQAVVITKFGNFICTNNSIASDFLIDDELPKYRNTYTFCLFVYDPKNMDNYTSRIDRQLQINGIPHNGSKTLFNNGFLLKFKQINSQHIPLIKDALKDVKTKSFYLLNEYTYFISRPIDFAHMTCRSYVQVENCFKMLLKAEVIKNPYNTGFFSLLLKNKMNESKNEVFISENEKIMTIFP